MEISIGDREFRLEKLQVRDQLHVSRRLTPLLQSFIPVIKTIAGDLGEELKAQDTEGKDFSKMALNLFDKNQDSIISAVSSFSDIISNLPDEQLDYIMDKCLSVCKWKNNNVLIPVSANPENFPLDVQFQLAFNVIKDSLGGFIQGLVMKAETATDQL